jgi:hypothetical protein
MLAIGLFTFATLGVETAQAGSYTITANGAQVCALGVFTANVPGFNANCDMYGSVHIMAPVGGSAYNDRQLWEIDSPNAALTITGTQFASIETDNINNAGEAGYGGGAYWNGGGQPLNTDQSDDQLGFGSDPDSSTAAFSSQYFGLQVVCSDSSGCDGQGSQANAEIVTNGFVSVAVQENQAPGLIAVGSNNLFYQANHWIWNAPGDPWSAAISGTDPSGICNMDVTVDNQQVGQVANTPNQAVWQQCPSPESDNAEVDTTNFVPSSGQLTLGISDQNAALVSTAVTSTLDVDNVAPTVSITPLNDANPGGWSVNHSVTLRVTPAAGPSGLSGVSCSDTVGTTATPLTLTPDPDAPGTYDVTVDGNGAHTVTCAVANTAVDPQGAHNSGSAAETVDIDEQPPSLSFAPTDPSNPTQVVVQTGDDESPVSGGSIQITAQGSGTPIMLPTSFTSNGQLIATIPDATLKAGAYSLQASATSEVGNTGTTSENVTLPLRGGTRADLSFAKVVGLVTKRVKERVLVGWHYGAKLNKHGKPVRVRLGGHYKTITVVKRTGKCKTKRVKIAKHKWKLRTACARPHLQYDKKLTIRHGKTAIVYGELVSSQGVPIAGQSVAILTAPNNGSGQFSTVGTATTDASGGWKTTLPAGPSRIVKASYAGSPTLRPGSGIAHLFVPARITIRVSSRTIRWSGVVTIRGQLKGGYIPRDGVAMRLLIRLPDRQRPYSPVPFRTTSKGTFSVRWSWGTGSGRATYPFSVATTANESDYPYSASASSQVDLTFRG